MTKAKGLKKLIEDREELRVLAGMLKRELERVDPQNLLVETARRVLDDVGGLTGHELIIALRDFKKGGGDGPVSR